MQLASVLEPVVDVQLLQDSELGIPLHVSNEAFQERGLSKTDTETKQLPSLLSVEILLSLFRC